MQARRQRLEIKLSELCSFVTSFFPQVYCETVLDIREYCKKILTVPGQTSEIVTELI